MVLPVTVEYRTCPRVHGPAGFGLTLCTRDSGCSSVSSSGTVNVGVSATPLDGHFRAPTVGPTQNHLSCVWRTWPVPGFLWKQEKHHIYTPNQLHRKSYGPLVTHPTSVANLHCPFYTHFYFRLVCSVNFFRSLFSSLSLYFFFISVCWKWTFVEPVITSGLSNNTAQTHKAGQREREREGEGWREREREGVRARGRERRR